MDKWYMLVVIMKVLLNYIKLLYYKINQIKQLVKGSKV